MIIGQSPLFVEAMCLQDSSMTGDRTEVNQKVGYNSSLESHTDFTNPDIRTGHLK